MPKILVIERSDLTLTVVKEDEWVLVDENDEIVASGDSVSALPFAGFVDGSVVHLETRITELKVEEDEESESESDEEKEDSKKASAEDEGLDEEKDEDKPIIPT